MSESWTVEPDGYLDEVVNATIARIGPFGESSTLMTVTFEGGRQMLFPLARKFGGKWRYADGLRPDMVVSARWTPNPDYVEGGDMPRAFFSMG